MKMPHALRSIRHLREEMWGWRYRAKQRANAIGGRLLVTLHETARRFDRRRSANVFAWLMRRIGPSLKEHRVGRANLAAAFPEKSPAEIEAILAGVWDNLGRVLAEFAHIDRLRAEDPYVAGPADIVYTPETMSRFQELQRDQKPALFFASHLANWEVSVVAATYYGVHSTVLFRRPNVKAVSDAILKIRASSVSTLVPAGLDAPVRLLQRLQAGGLVGMLVDQNDDRGVEVNFFGRRCKANPLIARLARHVECPIYGLRVVRLPGDRFRSDISPPVAPVRDVEGKIDVQGTMQAITSVVEDWVREHPEQWLWLHRRWR